MECKWSRAVPVELTPGRRANCNRSQLRRCIYNRLVSHFYSVLSGSACAGACCWRTFFALIAGEGPQRPWLEHLIRNLGLEAQVKLLGHLCRQELDACYRLCDLVILTSRSEGIPLVLMEAMAHGKTVLAPAITGIPELVKHGETGFLYQAGSLEDFLAQIEFIRNSPSALPRVRRAARQHVLEHFDREKNLAALADLMVFRITRKVRQDPNENPVLQQI